MSDGTRPQSLRDLIQRRREVLADPSNAAETAPSSTRGTSRPAKPKKKKKQPEAAGVGRDHSQSNAARLIKRLRAQAAEAETPELRDELARRIKAIEATVAP